jgi:phytoene/squalene synthetase
MLSGAGAMSASKISIIDKKPDTSQSLAEAITRSASRQTYYTIRFLVDRERVADAFRAYGYFRWVDDVLDAEAGSLAEKVAFVNRQKTLLETCYRGEPAPDLCAEEQILVDLVRHDTEKDSGLQAYLRNMMDVMIFDVGRRGQTITKAELTGYSHKLAAAVTEAIYYFVGHGEPAPRQETRYLAVTAAHIVHMLRDAFEDVDAGYYNIPSEFLQKHGISVRDIDSQAYRQWVCGRVRLARRYFRVSRASQAQIKNLRCRLASYAYTARFEWMLRTIERENYCLRCQYPDRKSLRASLWMAGSILVSVILFPWLKIGSRNRVAEPVRVKES